MPAQQRKERERARRHQLIITTARTLAETEGWEAVTTRRLADEIEYSQPVLYSHFAGKDAIVAAVALEGFADLAARLREAGAAADDSSREAGQAGGGSPEVEAPADGGPREAATAGGGGRREALARVCAAYAGFARDNPALYDAMFTLAAGLPFGRDDTPEPLRAAFDALVAALSPFVDGRDPAVLAEVSWSALHGLVALTRSGRLPPEGADERLSLLVDQLAASPRP